MSQLCPRQQGDTRSHLQLVSAPSLETVPVVTHGVARAYPQRLLRLLRAAGGGVTLERAGKGGFNTRGKHGFELQTTGLPTLQPLTQAGVSIHLIPALPGVTKGLASQRPRLVVGLPDDVDETLCQSLATLLRRAQPMGRQITAIDHLTAYRSLRKQFPDSELRLLGGAEAMTELMSQAAGNSVLVLPTGMAAVFASAALGLNGTGALSVSIEARKQSLLFVHETKGAQPVEAGALVLALGWLMLALGQCSVAARLHNAALKTLEDGIHTDALALLNPYARMVSDTAMLEAIIERVDHKPSRLPVAAFGARGDQSNGNVTLTCVS